MAKLKIGTITFIVNGYSLNNGLPYFQRAIPARHQARLEKKTIKIRLLEEHGNYALQCHRLTEQHNALFKAMDRDPRITPTENKLAALALLATYGLSPKDAQPIVSRPANWVGSFDETPHINDFFDRELPQGITPTKLALNARDALFNGLPVLLSEAFSVYLDNHKKSDDKRFKKAQKLHWDKVVNFTGDIALEAFSRDHAKSFRDHRLQVGIKPVSVKREIATIKAIFEKAIVELSLSMKNPFENLTIRGSDVEGRRPSFTKDELRKLIETAIIKDDERRRLFLCLALTGARLAEIVGLRKQDIDLDKEFILIVPHASRSLKTANSKRHVPMHPLAREALLKQIETSDSQYVFPSYASDVSVNADSVSAMMKKWIASVLPDTTKTSHSMRHTMADLLREANAPDAIKDAIGGWSNTKSVAEHYGEGHSEHVLRRYLLAALDWLPSSFKSHTGFQRPPSQGT
jgi:integrase